MILYTTTKYSHHLSFNKLSTNFIKSELILSTPDSTKSFHQANKGHNFIKYFNQRLNQQIIDIRFSIFYILLRKE